MMTFVVICRQLITSKLHFRSSFLLFRDLAGGLAIQETGMVFVKGINGCFFNVMGFPMSRFYQELRKFQ